MTKTSRSRETVTSRGRGGKRSKLFIKLSSATMTTSALPPVLAAMEYNHTLGCNGTGNFADGEFAGANITNCNITGMPSNQSTLVRDEELAKFEVAVQAIIFALAVIGNSIVLLVLFSRHKKLSRMNLMIVHLSVADLFVAFFNVLPQMIWDITYQFYGNDFLCRSIKYLQVVAMYASSYVLVTTAIDRYLAIVHPMTSQTWTSRKTHLLVAVAWGLSLGFAVPQLTIFAYREVSPGVYDCWASFDPLWTLPFYITWITVAIYIVPSVLLVFAYGRICHVVWRSMRAKEPSIKNHSQPKGMSWRNRGQQVKTAPGAGGTAENGTLLSSEKGVNGQATRSAGAGNPRAHVRGLSRAKVRVFVISVAVF